MYDTGAESVPSAPANMPSQLVFIRERDGGAKIICLLSVTDGGGGEAD